MKFYSTNKNSPEVNIRDAILIGQAPDKGLYLPKIFPKLTDEELNSLRDMNYPEMAFLVTSKMLSEFVPEEILKKLCKEAYDFDVPIEEIYEKKFIMRLDRGPTASFKDFAARLMARVIGYFIKAEERNIMVLVATSGDTGSAIADAFYGQENVQVVVLYPINEISHRQRKQMTTLGENITAIGVNGKFDDCQKLVKQAFTDPDLKFLNLSSANSINFGRLLPQTVYYFYAYSRTTKINSERVIFSVPSGNFGDLIGGLIAYKMGLPVLKFIAAVNENDEFPKFLQTGIYKKIVPSINCISSAMNVGHPSNLARLVDFYEGYLDETGILKIKPNMEILKQDISSISIDDEKTKKTIIDFFNKYKSVLEPHGAVGWAGMMWYLEECFDEDLKNKNFSVDTKNYNLTKNNIPCISLETADPSKFPEILTELLQFDPKMPKYLADLQSKKEEDVESIPADYKSFKKKIYNI